MEDNIDSIIEFSTDLSTAEAPVPIPGNTTYVGTIIEAKPKTGSTSGKRYISVRIRIPVAEYPADYDPSHAPDGTDVTYMRLGAEDTLAHKYALRRFMEDVLQITPEKSSRLDLSNWLHREVRVHIKHEVFDGITRAAIDKLEAV